MTYTPPTNPQSPVQCRHCGAPYDLGMVKPTSRHADCTMYATPCCGKVVDDRPFVSFPAFARITREEFRALADGRAFVNRDGTLTPAWRSR